MTCSTRRQIPGNGDAFFEEGGDGDFIGGVQDSRQGAAGLAGAAREIERGKIVVARRSKSSWRSLPKSSGGE